MGGYWSSTEDEVQEESTQQVVTVTENNWWFDPSVGGWVQINPSLHSVQGSRASSLDIKSAKLIRSPASLNKFSLKLIQDALKGSCYHISFSFDASSPVEITIYLDVREIRDETEAPRFSSHVQGWPIVTSHPSGQNQTYKSPIFLDLSIFGPKQWEVSLEANGFPMVVELSSKGDGIKHSQISYVTLKMKGPDISATIVHQRIVYGERFFNLEEIYGLDAQAQGSQDATQLKECVICLTNTRTTAVLPCRHLCLCSQCAAVLRIQNNRCPMCRQCKLDKIDMS